MIVCGYSAGRTDCRDILKRKNLFTEILSRFAAYKNPGKQSGV